MRLMVTNGGPHPADKWADVTTDAILDLIQVAEDSVSDEAMAARQAKRDLRPILFDILMGHHDGVQKGEQRHLATIKKVSAAQEHVEKPMEAHPDTDAALEEIFAVLMATPFASHFIQAEVRMVISNIVGQHTADVQHIERRWHVDRLNAAKGA